MSSISRKNSILPRKASGLIHRAIKNLEECEADNEYKVDPKIWGINYSITGNISYVGIPGCVMAKTFNFYTGKTVHPESFEKGVIDISGRVVKERPDVFLAINDFVKGRVGEGIVRLTGKYPDSLELDNTDPSAIGFITVEGISMSTSRFIIDVVGYEKNPFAFKLQMRELAFELKRKGY